MWPAYKIQSDDGRAFIPVSTSTRMTITSVIKVDTSRMPLILLLAVPENFIASKPYEVQKLFLRLEEAAIENAQTPTFIWPLCM